MALTPYTKGRFQVTCDGKFPGMVKKCSGGDASGEVAENKMGAHNLIKKHVTTIKYDDLTLEMGMGMSKWVWDWINASLNNNYQKKNWEYALADANGDIQMTKTLMDCLIKEFSLPKMEAKSKEPGYVTLKIQPQTTRIAAGGGGKVKGDMGKNIQKMWHCSNFRLDIPGMDCTKIMSIDALTWKQAISLNEVGTEREYETVANNMTQPDLKITMTAPTSKPWFDWYKKSVLEGHADETSELSGTLTFLHSNLKDELGHLEFSNIGIKKFSYGAAEAHGEGVMDVTVECYVEATKFVPKTTDA
jgi:phage tail-like protein